MAAVEQELDSVIKASLLTHKDSIVKGLVDGAIDAVKRDLGWKAGAAAEEMVTKFIKNDVLPEVQAHLEAHKAEIVASMLAGINDSLQAASAKLSEMAAKNISSSWNMKKVVEGLFG